MGTTRGNRSTNKTDPHYVLLPGKLHATLSDNYPYHEPLPQASIPDEITPYTVKHRFRHEKDGRLPFWLLLLTLSL